MPSESYLTATSRAGLPLCANGRRRFRDGHRAISRRQGGPTASLFSPPGNEMTLSLRPYRTWRPHSTLWPRLANSKRSDRRRVLALHALSGDGHLAGLHECGQGDWPAGAAGAAAAFGPQRVARNRLAVVRLGVLVCLVLFRFSGPFGHHADVLSTNLAAACSSCRSSPSATVRLCSAPDSSSAS